jgi:hypothetical protein
MSGGFMPLFQDLIPDAIPSQKYRMNMGSILSRYGDTGI